MQKRTLQTDTRTLQGETEASLMSLTDKVFALVRSPAKQEALSDH